MLNCEAKLFARRGRLWRDGRCLFVSAGGAPLVAASMNKCCHSLLCLFSLSRIRSVTISELVFDVVARATIHVNFMLLQNAQLDFCPLSSLSSRAMASNGHVDVNLPRATWHRAGGFLADFGVWLQSIGFGTWTVDKGVGNHLTDWWLHARMDSSCPAKSQVLVFVFVTFVVCFRWNVLTPPTTHTHKTILHESHASCPHSCLGVEGRAPTTPPHPAPPP